MPELARDRPRALLVTRNLPPMRGGMERLVQRIAFSASESFDLAVVGPTGCSAHLPPEACVTEVRHRPLRRFLLAGVIASWRQASRRNVGLVIAGSGLAAPIAWLAARRSRARWVVYLHGLDIIAPSLVYQRCWLPFIRRADLVLVNSGNTRRLAIESGVPPSAIEVLHPGTQLPGPDPAARGAFREGYDLGARPVMLSVGRFTPRKGLAEFIRHALPLVLSRHPDAILLVIGSDAVDAVRPAAGSEQARILEAAAEAGVSGAVRMLPPCDDHALSAAYRAADAYVFPVLDLPGDVEGFGMVAIEAAAHGLPTVAFKVGGVPDAIVEGGTGHLVEPGDYARFAERTSALLQAAPGGGGMRDCLGVAERFGWHHFEGRLRQLLHRLTGRTP
ncbi:glycosyltransferase family 4 protein [Luteimonas vadosa]|uniref:Glycosyltransferase family 4 protein n=1 Tax=Luteimonas vadosa TaxID=1165507 RepID=A0ABP9DRG4_9GAMM